MTEARQREAWNHTSTLLAMLANVNRPKRMRAFKPDDFHPMTGRRNTDRPLKGDIRMLKTVFVDNTFKPEPRR
jgi:hypothetical protein